MLLPVDTESLALIERNQPLLNQFALDLVIRESAVMVRRIPYLLSQVDIKALLSATIAALQDDTDPPRALADALKQLLPPQTIASQEQALQIWQQLSTDDLDASPWCRKLDQSTLTGLFSVQSTIEP
jgi:hypothetical protein